MGCNSGAARATTTVRAAGGGQAQTLVCCGPPARDDELALGWHHFPTVPDRAARVGVFLEAYGGLPTFDVAEAIVARMQVTMALELSLARAGVEPQRTWVAQGSQERAAGEARWGVSTPTC